MCLLGAGTGGAELFRTVGTYALAVTELAQISIRSEPIACEISRDALRVHGLPP
jgi:hypothetical protein